MSRFIIIQQESSVMIEALFEEALAISSIRAMFVDKYPPIVRVISIGVPLDEVMKSPESDKWLDYSIELCGGTHLGNTKEAEQFYVISEEVNFSPLLFLKQNFMWCCN